MTGPPGMGAAIRMAAIKTSSEAKPNGGGPMTGPPGRGAASRMAAIKTSSEPGARGEVDGADEPVEL